MNSSKLRFIEFSDVHLGHPNTPTLHIIQNLNHMVKNTDWKNVDVLIMAGDLFDRLLNASDPNLHLVQRFIISMFETLEKMNVTIIFLEGTPGHDWKQVKALLPIIEAGRYTNYFYYVDKIEILELEHLGINVLCIPDEMSATCDETWQKVTHLLNVKGLEQVDVAVMHGPFTHQMKDAEYHGIDCHVPERYLGIVKYVIFVGHVHTKSRYDRIFAAGSFDRLVHGEEGEKGYWDCTVYKDGEIEATFKVNRKAYMYKTLNVVGETAEEAYRSIYTFIEKNGHIGHIRVECNKSDPIHNRVADLKKQYPNIRWKFKEPKVETVKSESIVRLPTIMKITLNQHTLEKALLDRIAEKHPHLNINKCATLLQEVI